MQIKPETLVDGRKTYYYLQDNDDFQILIQPSKYLKHKVNQNCSINTVRQIAFSLSYYFNYLNEQGTDTETVLKMNYAMQQRHFMEYLYWLKMGKHSERTRVPMNNTCNSYLQAVFGYYEFLELEYHSEPLKVLQFSEVGISTTVGVRLRKQITTFKGYLSPEKHESKIISRTNLEQLLIATSNLRDRLLLLLLAETGLRIGELLGIRYEKDIDFDKRIITVRYREDNENAARAKYAEERRVSYSADADYLLSAYLSEYQSVLRKQEYLFVVLHGKTRGCPLTVNAVYSTLRTLKKQTGIETTPHMLRHYFANERRKAGWAIELISRALGHKHIETTEQYLHIEDDELIEATKQYMEGIEKLIPLGKLI